MNPVKALLLTTLLILQTSQAWATSVTDSIFNLSGNLTINATNNQVFNFTSFATQAGSVLDFSGLSTNDNVFIVASGDIHLDGTLNLPANFSFTAGGNLFLNGSIFALGHQLSLSASTISFGTNASINVTGGSAQIWAGNNTENNNGSNGGAGATICTQQCNDLTQPPPVEGIVSGGGQIQLNPPPPLTVVVPEPETAYLLIAGISLLMRLQPIKRG